MMHRYCGAPSKEQPVAYYRNEWPSLDHALLRIHWQRDVEPREHRWYYRGLKS